MMHQQLPRKTDAMLLTPSSQTGPFCSPYPDSPITAKSPCDVLCRCRDLVARGQDAEAATEADRALSHALKAFAVDARQLLDGATTACLSKVERDTSDMCRCAAAAVRIRMSTGFDGKLIRENTSNSTTDGAKVAFSSPKDLAQSGLLYRRCDDASKSVSVIVEEFALHIAEQMRAASSAPTVVVPAPLALVCVQAMLSKQQVASAVDWLRDRVIEPLSRVVESLDGTTGCSDEDDLRGDRDPSIAIAKCIVRGGLSRLYARRILQDALFLFLEHSSSAAAAPSPLRSVTPALAMAMSDASLTEMLQLEALARSRRRGPQTNTTTMTTTDEAKTRRQKILLDGLSNGAAVISSPSPSSSLVSLPEADNTVSSTSPGAVIRVSRARAVYNAVVAIMMHPRMRKVLGAAVGAALLGLLLLVIRRLRGSVTSALTPKQPPARVALRL